MNLLSVNVLIKPIYKFKLIDTTIWHYALLLTFDNGATIIVNWGPKIPLFNNNALVRFEKYEPLLWQKPRSYFWRANSTDSFAVDTDAVKERLKDVLTHIKSHYNGRANIKAYNPKEKYDWNDNNCEHFCSYIMYGLKISSQYDVFDDGKD